MERFTGRAEYLPQDKVNEQTLFPIGELELCLWLETESKKVLLLGSSGSGKTFLTRKCAETLGHKTAIYGLDKDTWEYRQFSGTDAGTDLVVLDDIAYYLKKATNDAKRDPNAVAKAVITLIDLSNTAIQNNAKVLLASTETMGYMAGIIADLRLRKNFLSNFKECCYYDDEPQMKTVGLALGESSIISRDLYRWQLASRKNVEAASLEYSVRRAFNMKDMPFLWTQYWGRVKHLNSLPSLSDLAPWFVNKSIIENIFGQALTADFAPNEFVRCVKEKLPVLNSLDDNVLSHIYYTGISESTSKNKAINLVKLLRAWHDAQGRALYEHFHCGTVPLASFRELSAAYEIDGEISTNSLNPHLSLAKGRRVALAQPSIANDFWDYDTKKDLAIARTALRLIWGKQAKAYEPLARELLAAGDDEARIGNAFLEESLRQEV